MEQTLGKRIVQHRKQLGLTQDQLAENLGVTAQAVSKWENDQSCPDITMLPKLAAIFHTTTDALLGMEEPKTVHEAQIVTEETKANDTEFLHLNNGNWEFKLDRSKSGTLWFAIWVILTGGLLLLSNIFHWNAGFWDILWPSALLVFGLQSLFSYRSFFFGCALTLFGGYFLLTNLNILDLAFMNDLLIPIAILLFGISLLFNYFRKPKKPVFEFSYTDGHDDEVGINQNSYHVDGETFTYSGSFGDAHQNISLPRLSHGQINLSFGDYDIDLSEVEELAEGCSIDLHCSFGDVTLLVPRKYLVHIESKTSFASVSTEGHPDTDPQGEILLNAHASFGNVSVEYI